MAHILIIGGLGFIGVNAALRHLRDGDRVTIFDDGSREGTDINESTLIDFNAVHCAEPRLTIVNVDISFTTQLEEAFSAMSFDFGPPDIVYHLAAQVAVTTSIEDPRRDFEINAYGSFNVLECCKNYARDAILIYASTNKVYGSLSDKQIGMGDRGYTVIEAGFKGITEEQQLDFHSPYGCSKGVADQYFLDYARIYGLKTVVFRQSCIYGPNQFGVEDQGWVAHFAISEHKGQPITVYGNGQQVRDLLHVDDLISAYLYAADWIEVTAGQAFNIGGGWNNRTSVADIIRILGNKEIEYGPERQGDQKCYVSDFTKFKTATGWEPKIDIEEGLISMQTWIKDNVSGAKA